MVGEHPSDPGQQARDVRPGDVEQEGEVAEHRRIVERARVVAVDLADEAALRRALRPLAEPSRLSLEDAAHLGSRGADVAIGDEARVPGVDHVGELAQAQRLGGVLLEPGVQPRPDWEEHPVHARPRRHAFGALGGGCRERRAEAHVERGLLRENDLARERGPEDSLVVGMPGGVAIAEVPAGYEAVERERWGDECLVRVLDELPSRLQVGDTRERPHDLAGLEHRAVAARLLRVEALVAPGPEWQQPERSGWEPSA